MSLFLRYLFLDHAHWYISYLSICSRTIEVEMMYGDRFRPLPDGLKATRKVTIPPPLPPKKRHYQLRNTGDYVCRSLFFFGARMTVSSYDGGTCRSEEALLPSFLPSFLPFPARLRGVAAETGFCWRRGGRDEMRGREEHSTCPLVHVARQPQHIPSLRICVWDHN